MSQRQFMHRVDAAVTRKVAQALLTTMRPLKRVLREQQVKIEKLQKEKHKAHAEERAMAAGLAEKLKNGLLSHLKRSGWPSVRMRFGPVYCIGNLCLHLAGGVDLVAFVVDFALLFGAPLNTNVVRFLPGGS
jgi:hypothetical protein